MLRPSVYQSPDSVHFLRAVLEARKKRAPSYSLRAWSKRIGFSNASFLSEILRGVRKLRPQTAARIAASLDLSTDERRYFDWMVLRENAKTPNERALYEGLMRELAPDAACFKVKDDAFRLVADWYHFALLETLGLTDCPSDSEALSRHLRNAVTPRVVSAAIARLERLGLVAKDRRGNWVRRPGHPHAGDGLPSGAVRRHHRQMIDRARRALVTEPPARRDIRSSMLAIRREKFEEAVKILRECHRKIQALESPGSAECVVGFNTQLFRISDGATP
jgi:uncharacterized protein (TIGR02147 family)